MFVYDDNLNEILTEIIAGRTITNLNGILIVWPKILLMNQTWPCYLYYLVTQKPNKFFNWVTNWVKLFVSFDLLI